MAYIGNTPADGEFKKADAISSTFNGVLTQFNIDYGTIQQSIGDPSQLIVSLNGVIQEPLTAYTLGIGGGSIIFASAPVSGDTCHIVILGGVGGTITPSDNSVTASKLSPSLKDFLEQNFVANGSQTTYTLSRAATGANTLLLSIDGILQPSSAFSVSGTTLTIDPALPNTTNVRVVHLGVVAGVYVPAPDSVTADMIANSINTDIATGVAANTTANAALPKAGGAMTGPITTNSTFDGVDIGVRDGILTSTTTTANAALPKAGGTMTGVIAGFESTGIDDNATSTAITIDASEIVTVGSTVSPALKVNRQSANGDAYIELQSNGTKVANLVGSSVGGFSVHTGASGTLTTALAIDNTGNVGIGTSSPNALLNASFNSSTAYSATGEPVESVLISNINGADGTGVNNYATLGFGVADGAVSQGFINYVRTADNTGAFTVSQRTGSATYAEHMRIDSSGNVGIGTTTPPERLSIHEPSTGTGTYLPVTITGSNYVTGYGVGISFKTENTSPTQKAKAAIIAEGTGGGNNLNSLHIAMSNTANTTTEVALADSVLEFTMDGRGVSDFTAKAWVNFNGTNTSDVRATHNVSSITDVAVGRYKVNFSNNLGSSNICQVWMAGEGGSNSGAGWCTNDGAATSYIAASVRDHNNSNIDRPYVTALAFGA